jgi:hypothetical protein
MKKYVNGEYIEMTEEEIANLPKDDVVIAEPTVLERLEAIEAVLLEQKESEVE